MRLAETMFVWDFDTKEIAVGPWPDLTGWSSKYSHSHGACESYVRKASDFNKTRILFLEAMSIIVGDGLDPMDVHNTLCEIKEYRDGLAQDMPVPEHLKAKFRREKGI